MAIIKAENIVKTYIMGKQNLQALKGVNLTVEKKELLSIIGKAFIKENINLLSAKITTIGSRAEDIFYITDRQRQPINDKDKQTEICAKLEAALNK